MSFEYIPPRTFDEPYSPPIAPVEQEVSANERGYWSVVLGSPKEFRRYLEERLLMDEDIDVDSSEIVNSVEANDNMPSVSCDALGICSVSGLGVSIQVNFNAYGENGLLTEAESQQASLDLVNLHSYYINYLKAVQRFERPLKFLSPEALFKNYQIEMVLRDRIRQMERMSRETVSWVATSFQTGDETCVLYGDGSLASICVDQFGINNYSDITAVDISDDAMDLGLLAIASKNGGSNELSELFRTLADSFPDDDEIIRHLIAEKVNGIRQSRNPNNENNQPVYIEQPEIAKVDSEIILSERGYSKTRWLSYDGNVELFIVHPTVSEQSVATSLYDEGIIRFMNLIYVMGNDGHFGISEYLRNFTSRRNSDLSIADGKNIYNFEPTNLEYELIKGFRSEENYNGLFDNLGEYFYVAGVHGGAGMSDEMLNMLAKMYTLEEIHGISFPRYMYILSKAISDGKAEILFGELDILLERSTGKTIA